MAASRRSLAFLFDLDGVVVDSNDLHVESWKEVARRRGFPIDDPEHIGKCGLRTLAVVRDLLRWPVDAPEAARIGLQKEEIYREWIRERGIRPIPGVREFLSEARRLLIPCAIGSSAPRANVDLCLASLGLDGLFQATVSGEDVARGKPAPDIFLLAARRLGADPAHCVVFEDAPAGIDAARAAGMRAIALLTSHAHAEIAHAHAVVRSFAEIQPDRLPLPP
jgi:beta-phosphoglucomutase family hydrolase